MVSSSVEVQGQPKLTGSNRAACISSNTKNGGSMDANAIADHHKEKDAYLQAATSSHSHGAVSKAIQILDSTTGDDYWDDSICSTTHDNSEHQQNNLFQTVSPILVKSTDGRFLSNTTMLGVTFDLDLLRYLLLASS